MRRWYNLGGTWMEPCWNLAGTLRETFHRTFWQPKTDLPQRTFKGTTKLGEPWWNLGETLEPWWNLGGTLAEPSTEPLGAPKGICRIEPSAKALLWLKAPKLMLLGKNAKASKRIGGAWEPRCKMQAAQRIVPLVSLL